MIIMISSHYDKVVIQRPGDTLVIPSRAPHTVLNLDWSIGVTENILTHEMLLGEADNTTHVVRIISNFHEFPENRSGTIEKWTILVRN